MATTVLRPQSVPPLPHYIPANEDTRIPQAQLGWMRTTPRDTPIEEMKARLKEDGYVHVKRVIPRDDVLKMRE
jgi:phytanoyl-CoA hydroxylase